MAKRLKIGFASRWSPLDKRSWSGTVHYTYEQIKKRFDVEVFQFEWNWLLREWLTTQKSFNRRLWGKQTSVEFLRSYSKYFSKKLTQELKRRPVDCLFVPASSQLIAFVETSIPIIYMTDATFSQLQGYYPGFSNLPKYNVRLGIELDKSAFMRSAHCMLASEWNRQSAISDYGILDQKITVAPCGANLDKIPVSTSINFDISGQCRLLFLAVDWKRKGGNIVLEAFRKIRAHHAGASLSIIGCVPTENISADASITVIPFLDKNARTDFQRLDEVFRNTDLLFLPTRAECAGVVFSEASAYGIPSVSTDTGGVTTYVKEGTNGYTLPLNAGPGEYADLITDLVSDNTRMAALRRTTRQFYEDHLSWELWGQKFSELVRSLVGDPEK
jgi:glycosyltransferase involved in cell wall biosynthesis